ncbi:MAG: 30S ribosomal protein S17 [bacterium]|nr:30S ribosomal protein S17 [bacterium]
MANNKRRLKGEIVSDKMNSSAVVAVVNLKKHPKYQKHYKVTSRYTAHNENNEFKTGDKVIIEECAPMSKTKKFKIVGKLNTNAPMDRKSSNENEKDSDSKKSAKENSAISE